MTRRQRRELEREAQARAVAKDAAVAVIGDTVADPQGGSEGGIPTASAASVLPQSDVVTAPIAVVDVATAPAAVIGVATSPIAVVDVATAPVAVIEASTAPVDVSTEPIAIVDVATAPIAIIGGTIEPDSGTQTLTRRQRRELERTAVSKNDLGAHDDDPEAGEPASETDEIGEPAPETLARARGVALGVLPVNPTQQRVAALPQAKDALAPPPKTSRALRAVLSASAMVLAAGVALSLSVPADALNSKAESQVAAEGQGSSPASSADAAADAQQLSASAADNQVTLSRDSFSAQSFMEQADVANVQTAPTFTNDPTWSIQWPFPVGVPISSAYGYRSYPRSGQHHGVDFVPGAGTPIQAIADGVVLQAGRKAGSELGVHVIIEHEIDGQKVWSVYAHMQEGSVEVEVGQQVHVTDTLGRVGSTGFSTGAHLHFEIRLNGTQYTNPFTWMQQHVG